MIHYQILKQHPNIEIVDRQKTFLLINGFPYIKLPNFNKGNIRKMEYTPDFILKIKGIDKPIAMETKGHARKDYMMRKKLFIYFYGDKYYFYECKDNAKGEKLKKDIDILLKGGIK